MGKRNRQKETVRRVEFGKSYIGRKAGNFREKWSKP